MFTPTDTCPNINTVPWQRVRRDYYSPCRGSRILPAVLLVPTPSSMMATGSHLLVQSDEVGSPRLESHLLRPSSASSDWPSTTSPGARLLPCPTNTSSPPPVQPVVSRSPRRPSPHRHHTMVTTTVTRRPPRSRRATTCCPRHHRRHVGFKPCSDVVITLEGTRSTWALSSRTAPSHRTNIVFPKLPSDPHDSHGHHIGGAVLVLTRSSRRQPDPGTDHYLAPAPPPLPQTGSSGTIPPCLRRLLVLAGRRPRRASRPDPPPLRRSPGPYRRHRRSAPPARPACRSRSPGSPIRGQLRHRSRPRAQALRTLRPLQPGPLCSGLAVPPRSSLDRAADF